MNKLEIIEKIAKILQDHESDVYGFELVLYGAPGEISYDEMFTDDDEADLEEDPLQEIKF